MAQRTIGSSRRKRGLSGKAVGVGAICASMLLAAFILSRGKSAQIQAAEVAPTIVAEYETVMVPVPVKYVPTGTRVRDIDTKRVPYPRHQVPKEALTDLSMVGDAYTIAPLPANLPIFETNLNKRGQSVNPVVERIPPGMRAMTISVDATSAVEGWAGSGAIVDVLLVQKDRTTVVAESVKILSAERSVSPIEGSAAPSVPRTVTLLVTQEQCLAINTAIPQGKIAFALRGSADDDRWASSTYLADRLRGGPGVMRNKDGIITGYANIKEGSNERSYALTDGKWIRTEAKPQGFLAGDGTAQDE